MNNFTLPNIALMERLQGNIGFMAATPMPYEIRSQIKRQPDITLYPNGNIASQKWRNNGLLHRVDGPAEINYNFKGDKINESWYKNGKRTRVNNPALITFGYNGQPIKEVWYTNGKKTKENFYDDHYDLMRQQWWKNGKLHRDRGPAKITYRFNADKNTMEIGEQIYYENGKVKQRSNDKPNKINNTGSSIDEYTLDPNGRIISFRRSGINIPTMFGNTARICGRKQRKRVNKRAK